MLSTFHMFVPELLCLLQGLVYNVVPWLTAILLALCGGFVSDFLIKQGMKVIILLLKCFIHFKQNMIFLKDMVLHL